MSEMKNKALSLEARKIPYIPALRDLAGSIGAAVLVQQLEFRFAQGYESGFYKFMGVPENAHPAYRQGDSWSEELNCSVDEFRGMFDKIGKRYGSLSEYRQTCADGDPFQGKPYLSYVDRKSNLTWYFRNHEFMEPFLDKLIAAGSKIKEDPDAPAKAPPPTSPAEWSCLFEKNELGTGKFIVGEGLLKDWKNSFPAVEEREGGIVFEIQMAAQNLATSNGRTQLEKGNWSARTWVKHWLANKQEYLSDVAAFGEVRAKEMLAQRTQK